MSDELGLAPSGRIPATIEDVPGVLKELEAALKAKTVSTYTHLSAIIGSDPKWSIHASYNMNNKHQHTSKIFRGEDGTFDAAAAAMRD